MRSRFPRLAAVLSPLPILLACASAGARDSHLITAPELSRGTPGTAYDAIRRIRPEMLRTRDPGSMVYFKPSRPAVAVDNILVGGVDVLRHLPAVEAARVEYVDSWVAARRYGMGFGNGLLLIETRADSVSEAAAGPSGAR
ncbi:MAG TPA: hypothetical protein VEB59_01915 [Gemmatimonadales bacterium]|nr:hypothetical protein [Gemmatimonadales bacterium]